MIPVKRPALAFLSYSFKLLKACLRLVLISFALTSATNSTVGAEDVSFPAINLRQIALDYPWSGRVNDIAFDPRNPRTLVVGTESAGLFRSDDGGRTFSHQSRFPEFHVQRVIFGPSQPGGDASILYATVRKPTYRQYSDNAGIARLVKTSGIWISSNSGETWRPLDQESLNNSGRCPELMGAHGMDVDSNGEVAIATDCGVVVISRSGNPRLLTPPNGRTDFSAVAFAIGGSLVASFGNSDSMWVIGNPLQDQPSWAQANLPGPQQGEGPRANRDGAAQHQLLGVNGIVYTYQDHCSAVGTNPCGQLRFNFYGSANSGQTWSRIQGTRSLVRATCGGIPGVFAGTRVIGGQYSYLAFSDACNGFVGQCDASLSSGPDACLSSWNIALTYDRLLNGSIDHDDVRVIRFGGPQGIAIGSDGGLHLPQSDVLVPVRSVGTASGLNALQVYNVAGRPATMDSSLGDYELVFGTQDNSFGGSTDGGETWPNVFRTEGAVRGPEFSASLSAGSLLFVCDAGSNDPCWFTTDAITAPAENRWSGPPPGVVRGTQVDPIVLPSNLLIQARRPDTYVTDNNASNDGLVDFFVSRDRGVTWRRVVTDAPIPIGGAIKAISSVSNSTNAQMINIYYVYNSGRCSSGLTLGRLSINPNGSGQTRPQLSSLSDISCSAAPVPQLVGEAFHYYSVFDVNVTDQNHILLVDRRGGLFETRDAGNNWNRLTGLEAQITDSGKVPLLADGGDQQIRMVQFSPDDPSLVLVGTIGRGLYVSSDGANTFFGPFGLDIPISRAVHWVSANLAILSSYGRGLWRAEIDNVTYSIPEDFRETVCSVQIRDCLFNLETGVLSSASELPGRGNGQMAAARAVRGDIRTFGVDASGVWTAVGGPGSAIKLFGDVKDVVRVGRVEKNLRDSIGSKGKLHDYLADANKIGKPLEIASVVLYRGAPRYAALRPKGVGFEPLKIAEPKDLPVSKPEAEQVYIGVKSVRIASGLPAFFMGEPIPLLVQSMKLDGEYSVRIPGEDKLRPIRLAPGKIESIGGAVAPKKGLHVLQVVQGTGEKSEDVLATTYFIVTHRDDPRAEK